MGLGLTVVHRLVELKAEGEQRSRSEEARKSLEAGAQRYERRIQAGSKASKMDVLQARCAQLEDELVATKQNLVS